jgi:hypothetical protein
MQLKVEFLGLARELAGAPDGMVALVDQATWRDLLRELALRFPALYGPVITPDRYDLAPAYMLNVGGRTVVRDYSEPAQPGQRLLLMFAEAGG